MGHFERQADRYADEIGRLEAIEQRAELQWQELRAELAEQLADGKPLKVGQRTVLEFDDVIDRLCCDYDAEHRACLLLSVVRPELGGQHFKQLIEREAQSLVDDFKDAFITELEKDHD